VKAAERDRVLDERGHLMRQLEDAFEAIGMDSEALDALHNFVFYMDQSKYRGEEVARQRRQRRPPSRQETCAEAERILRRMAAGEGNPGNRVH
jgi:hypothetical protein